MTAAPRTANAVTAAAVAARVLTSGEPIAGRSAWPADGDPGGELREFVVHRRQVDDVAAAAQGTADQFVGEAGALGEDRPVQVGADHVVAYRALGAVAAVVATPAGRRPERAHAAAELGQPAVVLVADEPSGVHLARGVDPVVADQARVLAPGDHVEHPDTGDAAAVVGEEFVTQHLVAAADGQHDDAVVGHRAQVGAAAGEVRADLTLRGVLAAAAEQDVRLGRQRVADAHRHDLDR